MVVLRAGLAKSGYNSFVDFLSSKHHNINLLILAGKGEIDILNSTIGDGNVAW